MPLSGCVLDGRRFQTALQNLGIGLVVTDSHGNFVAVNRAFSRMTGYSEEELRSEKWCSIMRTEIEEPDFDATRQRSVDEVAGSGEKKYRRKDGEAIWLRMASACTLRENFPEPCNLFIVEDITDRKEAEEGERRRIARELHDTTGQSLVALTVMLSLAGKKRGVDPASQDAVAECLALAKQVENEVRTLSFLLYPAPLDHLGLADALRQYARGFSNRSGIKVALRLPKRMPALERDITSALFRVVVESLHNVWRHSGSGKATISFGVKRTCVVLQVRDFGSGTKPPSASKRVRAAGLGIRSMRDRMRQLGADLDVELQDTGTVVRVCVPL